MADPRERDRVVVERAFEGVPDPDYPPKGIVKEIERRYGISTESVEFPDGRMRVIGWADPDADPDSGRPAGGAEPLNPDMGGV